MIVDPWKLREMPAELRPRYLKEGWWDDRTLGHMLLGWLAARPELEFRVWSKVAPQRSTFGAVHRYALQLAAGLARRGIRAGDAVCIYVPNSIEGAIGFMAVPAIGGIVVPVAPFYGLKELKFILAKSEARLLVTTDDPQKLDGIAAMRAELPKLEDVYIIGNNVPAGMKRFAELIADAPLADPPKVDPDSIAGIAFTSGTTTDPKGVVHTHRSICCEVWLHIETLPGPNKPLLMGGPIAHIAGMLLGLFVPPLKQRPVHIIDGWDPGLVLHAIRTEGVSAGSGTPFFLNSLMTHPDFRPEDLRLVEAAMFGAATIPVPFAEKMDAMGVKNGRCYGSTEHPTITCAFLSDPPDKRHRTDGRALPGVEVRIVDEDGRDVAEGSPGELISRGPELCAGYIDPKMNAELFLPGGWFRTGDVGVRDADGFITITDRIKDIIVRNGVKVGAVEVEDVILAMPQLIECALVAAPDERTGEKGYAFLRLKPGESAPTLAEVRAHLEKSGMARQKWPEAIEVVDDFPRTPAGKIKKFELRNRVRAALAPKG
jgi:acyl-CoA synthetase (AMP-forming)/AMP-acid ligase II